jgi:hypothetical protein
MFAPPPSLPIVVIAPASSNSFPRDGPSTTQILKRWASGSWRLAAIGNGVFDKPIGLGLSRGRDDGIRIVAGLDSERTEPVSMVDWHIQQVVPEDGALSE